MTEYWKSNTKKFCEFCKCWIADNKPSIEFHEKGKRHQNKVARKIKEISKRGKETYENKLKEDEYMKTMEQAALRAYQKDVEINPDLSAANPVRTGTAQDTKAALAAIEKQRKEEIQEEKRKRKEEKEAKKRAKEMSKTTYGPPVKPTPYSQWQPADSEPQTVDLELPELPCEVSYIPEVSTRKPEISFEEKIVSLNNAEGTCDVAFKKRKGPDQKRNVRQRTTDL